MSGIQQSSLGQAEWQTNHAIQEALESQICSALFYFYSLINRISHWLNLNNPFFEDKLAEHHIGFLAQKNISIIQSGQQGELLSSKALENLCHTRINEVHKKALYVIGILQFEYARNSLQRFREELDDAALNEKFSSLPNQLQTLIKGAFEFEYDTPFTLKDLAQKDVHASILIKCDELLKSQMNAYIAKVEGTGNSETIQKTSKLCDELLFKPFSQKDIFETAAAWTDQTALITPMNVTMLSVEYSPFAKEGGLAEAVEGMSLGVLNQQEGNHVRLIFPKFSTIPEQVLDACDAPREYVSSKGQVYRVYTYDYHGVECCLIEDPSFILDKCDPSIYGPDYESLATRFATFSRLAADYIKDTELPDVVHLHDWHVASTMHALKSVLPEEDVPPVVFSYHNNGRPAQGRIQPGCYSYDPVIRSFQESGVAGTNENLFVSTLLGADMVTTVSRQFGLESQTLRYGEGVSFATQKIAMEGKLVGILNGANPDRWNPETNQLLQHWTSLRTGEPIDLSYSPETPSVLDVKELSKLELQAYLERYMPDADVDFSKPIITYVGRFDTYQKGLDHLDTAIYEILKNGGQFICMGISEDEKATEILDHLEDKYPKGVLFLRDYKTVAGKLYYQQGDEHRPGIGPIVRAATDSMFMPSNFEPCGLVQFEGWLFGSLAIGAETGGLADSIVTREKNPEGFNGFLFHHDSNQQSMRHRLKEALHYLKTTPKDEKEALCKRLMTEGRSFSWSTSVRGLTSAEQYKYVYEAAIAKRHLKHEKNYFDRAVTRVDTPLSRLKGETSAEEAYLKEFYLGNLSPKAYQRLYQSLPSHLRKNVPAPGSKGVTSDLHKTLGSHLRDESTTFAVKAPKATAVELILYNDQGNEITRHPLVSGNNSVWSLTLPQLLEGAKYRYEIGGRLKIDPFGHHHVRLGGEDTPYSVVTKLTQEWSDGEWMQKRKWNVGKPAPMSIYEMHPLSWKKQDGNPLNYRELAHQVVAHTKEYGFTHVELMGILEHPHEGSWGYQVTGYFAPTSRMGTLDDFAYLVNYLHEHEVGVILDWVPAHFAKDDYGLGTFDKRSLFESAASLSSTLSVQNLFFDYGGTHFDYSKKYVRDFLISNALFWLKDLHIDGIRTDCVRSLLNTNDPQSAHHFLSALNQVIHTKSGGGINIAEDFSGTYAVTRPQHEGGFEFDRKWHVGWLNKVSSFFKKPFAERRSAYHKLQQALQCDNFHKQVLPISHDHVAGKQPLHGPISPETLADQKAHLAFLMTCPGKKLLFMGEEFGNQLPSWETMVGQEESGLLDTPLPNPQLAHEMKTMMKALNELYKREPAFYERDENGHDIEWIDDPNKAVHAFRRQSEDGTSFACLHNFSSHLPQAFTVTIPNKRLQVLDLSEVFTSDDANFGGNGICNIDFSVNHLEHNTTYTVHVPPHSSIVIKEGRLTRLDPPKIPPSLIERTQGIFSAILGMKRYFGAKSWSLLGATYRLFEQLFEMVFKGRESLDWEQICPTEWSSKAEKRLSQDEAKDYLVPLGCSGFAFSGDDKWITPLGVNAAELSDQECQRLGLRRDGKRFIHNQTEIPIAIAENENEFFLAFPGATSQNMLAHIQGVGREEDREQVNEIVYTALGAKSEHFEKLEELYRGLKKLPKFRAKPVKLVGQSRGGSYAQYIALKTKGQAVCINAFPIGAGLQSELPETSLAKAKKYCTHLVVESDPYNDNGVLRAIDSVLSTVGVKTPGSFGRTFSIPTAYTSATQTHTFALGSLFKYLGYDIRTSMEEYAEQEGLGPL